MALEGTVEKLANRWFIELHSKRLCQSFLKFQDGAVNQPFEKCCDVYKGVKASLGKSENVFPKSMTNLANLCIGLAKKNLNYKGKEELKSVNEIISHLCLEFHVSEIFKDSLIQYLNVQRVVLFHMSGEKEKAKDLFLELQWENQVLFGEDLKALLLVKDSEVVGIPVHLQYQTFLNLIQYFVSYIIDQLGDCFLEQIANSYLRIEEENPRMEQKEFIKLFKQHLQPNAGDSILTGLKDFFQPDTNGESKGKKKSRKMLDQNESYPDQKRDPRPCLNRAECGMAQNKDVENPSASAETRPKITNQRQKGHTTPTRPEDPNSDESDSDKSAVLLGKTTSLVKAKAASAAKNASKTSSQTIEKTKDETVERSGAGRIVLNSGGDDSSHYNYIAPVCPNNDPKETSRPGRVTGSMISGLEDFFQLDANGKSKGEKKSRKLFNHSQSTLKQNSHSLDRAEGVMAQNQDAGNTGKSLSAESRPKVIRKRQNRLATANGPENPDSDESNSDQSAVLLGTKSHAVQDQDNTADYGTRKRQKRHTTATRPENPDSDESSFAELDRITSTIVSAAATSKKRRPFTEQEETWVEEGVKLYGVGNWQLILRKYPFQGRTTVNLKDKWRNKIKKEKEEQNTS